MKIPNTYLNKSLPALKKIAVKWCHLYIRTRDEGKPCVSCGNYRELQAGHFFSGGKYGALKYDERNIHGQCKKCNYFGSMEEGARYEREIVNRIGQDAVDELHRISKTGGFRFDRFSVIDKILHYKRKCHEIGAR